MRDIFSLIDSQPINPDAPFIRAYPHLLSYFAQLHEINASNVVCGAHMVYGWMPTVLSMCFGNEDDALIYAASILNRVRQNADITALDIKSLSRIVNNSLVGTSKLLHFLSPGKFPIWDSRVYRFVHEMEPHHYRVNNIDSYLDYMGNIHALVDNCNMIDLQTKIETQIGYKITPVRAAELVMFVNGGK